MLFTVIARAESAGCRKTVIHVIADSFDECLARAEKMFGDRLISVVFEKFKN